MTISPARQGDVIEITPKMIEFGVNALRENCYGTELSALAEMVYLRMEAERRDHLQRLTRLNPTHHSEQEKDR